MTYTPAHAAPNTKIELHDKRFGLSDPEAGVRVLPRKDCTRDPDSNVHPPEHLVTLWVGQCETINITSNNIMMIFSSNFPLEVSKGITLYTDQNCKNKGKPTTVPPPLAQDPQIVCMHPSDFGGEKWGSVMIEAGKTH